MKNRISPQWIMGLLMGIIMPILGIFLVLDARPELVGLQRFEGEVVKHVNTQIITLGIIINAALFFVFLQFNKEDISRGILFASVVYLVGIFVYRFLL
tara:strand:- start:1312 stop:1605 length:294 start_codon:yes stop_codon:yes gene_type:complete